MQFPTEPTWDTGEAYNVIANDQDLYERVVIKGTKAVRRIRQHWKDRDQILTRIGSLTKTRAREAISADNANRDRTMRIAMRKIDWRQVGAWLFAEFLNDLE